MVESIKNHQTNKSKMKSGSGLKKKSREIPGEKKQDLFLSPNLDLNVKRKGISRTKLLSGLEFVPLPVQVYRTIAVILQG